MTSTANTAPPLPPGAGHFSKDVMNAEIKNGRIIVTGKMPRALLAAISQLEGGKRWLRSGGFSTPHSGHNVKLLTDAGCEGLEPPRKMSFPHAGISPGVLALARPGWAPPRKCRDHQRMFLAKEMGKRTFALFAEMGTGKTKMAIDAAARRWCEGLIDAVMVIAPKGVHLQWLDALEEDLQPNIEPVTYGWDGKSPIPGDLLNPEGRMPWLTFNYAAVGLDRVKEQINRFYQAHPRRVLLIIDESHMVKNPKAKRWKAVKKLADVSPYVLALTGSPITKDLVDYWGQFKLLDESIIGIRYLTTFRAQYCVMGGYEMRQVVAHKNEEKLYALTEPYTYRITKDEALDLPPKAREQVHFEMDPKQKRAFNQMKTTFIAELEGGVYQTAANAAVAVTRLHQITCGYLPDEEGKLVKLPNPRLTTLKRLLESIEGKVIIWARYNYDIEIIAEALGEEAVTYYGGTSGKARAQAKAAFIKDPAIRYMVSNPAAGGRGVDGYQGVCSHAIYYSNSFNAEERWQSEDRIHRDGMGDDPATYIDIICRGGVDGGILSNLRAKRSMSDLMLDDIRRLLDD